MSQQKEIGTLVVVVLKAQHLHQPSFYKQDPYVRATLSGVKKRTKVDPKGGQHPVWDDELRFTVLADVGKDKVNRTLEISCFKDEQRGDDVLLGKGSVDIGETLKTGEFDDWVPLETSAGPRGEVYLEMTFYANSPPLLTRRPSKLNPSDRLARPAAYLTQGSTRQLTPSLASPSPQSGRSPVAAERKPSQPLSPASVSQIPSSLLPAQGFQGPASRQAPPNGSAPSVVAIKHKDTLPPLPANSDATDSDAGKNLGLPAVLHPGGRSGPRPMPSQNRNRGTNTGHPPLEVLPSELHRRTLSDTPAVALSSHSSRTQTSGKPYSPETTFMVGIGVSSTPSIVVEEHDETRPALAFPIVPSPPSGFTHEHEVRDAYATGERDSFSRSLPTQVHAQPNSSSYIPASTQSYWRTRSQSPHIPPGQPLQFYDASLAITSPFHQRYTQPPNEATPQPLTAPRPHSAQPQQQQSSYLWQPEPQLQPAPLHQQPYPLTQQQQYHLQHLPYTETPQPPHIPHPCTYPGLPSNSQPPTIPQYQPQYCQPQSHPIVPPPPPVWSQTPQPHASQQPHQPQLYFSHPPPPPPPPPLYIQGRIGSSDPGAASQALRSSVSPSSVLSAIPVSPSLQHKAAALQPPRPSSDSTLAFSAEVKQGQVDGQNEAKLVTVANVGIMQQGDTLGTLECAELDTLGQLKDSKENEASANDECMQEKQHEKSQRQEVRRRVEEDQKWREVGYSEREEGHEKQEDRQGKYEEEVYENREEERRRIEDEERRRREVEELGKEREHREREEQDRGNREEESRRREEEDRRGEVERKRDEEWREKEEQEHKRRKEEQREREEQERKRQEEEEHREREEQKRKRQEEEEHREREEQERKRQEEEEHREREEQERKKREEEEQREREEQERKKREEEEQREREEQERKRREEEEQMQREREEAERRRKAEAERRRAEEAEAERKWQEELTRIRARAEQEAADAAFARAQMEAEEAERQRQDEANLAFVRQAQEEAERDERLAQLRRRQEEADMEVARREQAHEEELERRRQEERRLRMEEADRELARKLDRELNLGTE